MELPRSPEDPDFLRGVPLGRSRLLDEMVEYLPLEEEDGLLVRSIPAPFVD